MVIHKIKFALLTFLVVGVALCSTGFAKDKNSSNIDEKFIPGEDSGFFYTIKKGDTLWNLSQKFYNSKWDWPGLWEMNDEIKNPHLIYPGEKVRIFLRKKAKLKPIIVKAKKLNKSAAANNIETSFSFSQMDHIGFIKKSLEPSLGSVIKEEEDNLIMSVNDIIYIKPSSKGKLIPGRKYQIFTTEKVEKKKDNPRFSGVKHLIKAQIKILEHKTTYVTALLTNSYRAVKQGDMVMEYYTRNSILKVEDAPDPIDAKILCSENNNIMINDYTVAFINVGKDQVKPGQVYNILRKNKLTSNATWPNKKKEDLFELENLKSGQLIVLHTEDIASTVMILSSRYAIYPNSIVN